ncbi:hypothetical protein [Hymenobacter persicinus]|uniref:hypothetical protein n=1 Tax=Hymenobacter persicinus TaxID=2025506 RepID=UPI0013ED89EF|nr:hypothetical protein [Hymenobacter persicinus]
MLPVRSYSRRSGFFRGPAPLVRQAGWALALLGSGVGLGLVAGQPAAVLGLLAAVAALAAAALSLLTPVRPPATPPAHPAPRPMPDRLRVNPFFDFLLDEPEGR